MTLSVTTFRYGDASSSTSAFSPQSGSVAVRPKESRENGTAAIRARYTPWRSQY